MYRRYGLLLVAVLCVVSTAALAQPQSVPQPPRPGIVVGAPAVYDYEAMRVSLESLVAELAAAKPLLNIQDIHEALGGRQASTAQERYDSFRLTGPDVGGGKAADVTAPTLSAAGEVQKATTPDTTEKMRFGGHDLLAQQLELSYRIANLRLLLDESDSDRFQVLRVTDKNGNQTALACRLRRKAVLGFQVSIDNPLPEAVANVEFTVSAKPPATTTEVPGPRLAVIRIFPEDKTYNASMLTSKTSDFGLGAAVNLIGFGALFGNRNSALYLVRDTDTVALLKPPTAEGTVSFGWQFRPVLGRKSIVPGKRDVYVALALPATQEDDCELQVSAKVSWQRFNPKKKTVGDYMLNDRLDALPDKAVVAVPSSQEMRKRRSPLCSGATVTAAGADRAMVVLDTADLDQNTSVVIGARTVREPDLIRTGYHRLAFSASVDELAANPVGLASPYGYVNPVYEYKRGDGDPEPPNYQLSAAAKVYPVDATNTRVELTVKPKTRFWDSSEIGYPWYAKLGSTYYAFARLNANACAEQAQLSLTCETKALRDARVLEVGRLCVGDVCRITCDVPPPSAWEPRPLGIDSVTPVGEDEQKRQVYAVVGGGLQQDPRRPLRISMGGEQVTQITPVSASLMHIAVPKETAGRADKLVVYREGETPVIFSLTKPAKKPALTVGQAGMMILEKTDKLDPADIATVTFGEKALKVSKDVKDGKDVYSLYPVELLTAKEGTVTLLVTTKTGKVAELKLEVGK
ncbi:hypothetical protein LLH23_19050 [bacterium]|nr:hypothetical protein [bacterium]